MGRLAVDEYLRRVKDIQKQCGGGEQDQKKTKEMLEEEKKMDEFDRLKKALADQLATVREKLKEREELPSGSKETVEISQEIRKGLATIKSNAQELSKMYENGSMKKKGAWKKPDVVSARKEQLDNIWEHVKEVEAIDRRRYQPNANVGGGKPAPRTGGGMKFDDLPQDPTRSNLPEIDLTEFHDYIDKNNKEIDDTIGRIGNVVGRLHEQAKEMNRELETQNTMIIEIDNKVEKHTDTLENLNVKLDKIIKQLAGPDKFCMYIICLFLILAIAGVIYYISRLF